MGYGVYRVVPASSGFKRKDLCIKSRNNNISFSNYGSDLVIIDKFSRKILILILLILLIIVYIPVSDGAEQFFPLEKIKPGMTGYGYTVFIGTKIEKFSFKVLATVDGTSEETKLILIRLSGKSLEKNGGLAAGMSGSPVYIGRKLVGAVSYGFENADPFLALVTPIRNMLNLFNSGDKARATIMHPNLYNYYARVTSLGLKPVPVTTPVFVTGMGNRGYELISRILAKNGLKAVFWPDLSNSKETNVSMSNIKPGSAISVQMLSGDYQVSAIGTVTYINNDDFLAFGHSFTNKGTVDYLAFQAYIFQTVKSPELSFKLGAPLKIIGRITQDRLAGISGRFGETPDLITVMVNVKDLERNTAKLSSFQVISNEQMYPDLIIAGVTDAIDKTIDRVGNGTATVAIRIETAERAEPIFRMNMFYSKDIAVACLNDLENLLNILAVNEFSKAIIKTVKIDIEVQNKQVSARIMELTSDRQTLKPGETFNVNAGIHTYRGDVFEVPFAVKLPDNVQTGKLVLNISGGGKQYLEDTGEGEQKKANTKFDNQARSLSELITKYTTAPKNNELVLEYYPSYSDNDSKNIKDQTANNNKELKKPVKMKYQTDYFIYGDATLTVEIK